MPKPKSQLFEFASSQQVKYVPTRGYIRSYETSVAKYWGVFYTHLISTYVYDCLKPNIASKSVAHEAIQVGTRPVA